MPFPLGDWYFPSSRADFRGVSLAANWTADRKECRPPTRPSIPRDFRMSAQGKPRRVRVIGAVTSELNIIFSDECRPLNLAGRVCARVRACHRSYYRGHLVPDRLYTSLLLMFAPANRSTHFAFHRISWNELRGRKVCRQRVIKPAFEQFVDPRHALFSDPARFSPIFPSPVHRSALPLRSRNERETDPSRSRLEI